MRSDLWYDEVYSYRTASLPFNQMFHTLLLGGDTNPPLYTVLLHFWLKFGDSDVHIKTLSLLFGLAAIGLMFRLGKLVGGRRLAFLAAFLFSVSDSVVRYSVEARPYALFLFLTLLSTVLLLSVTQVESAESPQPPSRRLWVWYGIVTTLAIYTHWFSLLLLPIHLIALLIYSRHLKATIRSYAVVLLAILCCCLPLLSFLIGQVSIQNTVGGFSWCGKPNQHAILDLAYFLSGGKNLFFVTLVIILITLLTAWWRPPAAGLSKRHTGFFCAYVLIPLISVAGISYTLSHYSFFVPRYFLPFIIGVHLLTAACLLRLSPKLACLFLLVFTLSPFIKTMRHRHRPENSYSLLAIELQKNSRRPVFHLSPMSYYPTLFYCHDASQTQRVAWSEQTGLGYVADYNIKGGALSPDNLFNLDKEVYKQSEFYVVRDLVDHDPIISEMENHLRINPGLVLVSESKIDNLYLELYRAGKD